MIRSMTGYGQATGETDKISANVTIKTLNSKNFDLNVRMPQSFYDREIELRNFLNKQLTRGKAFLTMEVTFTDPTKLKKNINKDLIKLYHQELDQVATDLNLDKSNLLNTLVNLPEIFETPEDEDIEEEWRKVFEVAEVAARQVDEFRKKEGHDLKQNFLNYLETIEAKTKEIEAKKDERIELVRQKLKDRIQELEGSVEIDQNRYEQEVIYYAEKMDITEELVRLQNHCKHFRDTIDEESGGKKLNFISQEMGRETNTIGAKANDYDIQETVVTLKNELEKIKEQVQNIL